MQLLGDLFGSNKANDTNVQAQQTYQASNDQLANIQGQQQNFANQLQQQAAGNGPSVAQAMLNNAASQNAANSSAIAAGARGINPGLALRQALQSNAANNQAAAQQAVVGKQQEQLNAQGMLGGQLNQMFGQGYGTQQGNQAANLAAQQAQAGVEQANAKRSSDVQSGLLNGLSGSGNMAAASKAFAQGGMIPMYAAGSGNVATPTVNDPAPDKSHIANYFGPSDKNNPGGAYMGGQAAGKIAGNLLGKGLTALLGSSEPKESQDIGLQQPQLGSQFSNNKGPSLGVNTQLPAANLSPSGDLLASNNPGTAYGYDMSTQQPLTLSKGGRLERKPLPQMKKKMAALVSPGEVYLSPDKVKEVLKGADPMKVGHHVPGKAKKKDDSYSNDTVHAQLQEGGVVVPRHITTHEKAPEKAAAFVRKAVAKQGVPS